MRIEVTQEDIDSGIAYSVSSCPVAKAIRRQVKEAQNVFVSQKDIFITGKTRKFFFFKVYFYRSLPTPKSVASFITKFDAYSIKYNQDILHPFRFDLDV